MTLRDVVEPDSSGKVLIDVRAAGVNYPDLLMTQGAYQMKVNPPFIPGAEVSGVVLEVPAGSRFNPGDRVLALCGLGGYAQKITVESSMVIPAPPELDFVHSVALIANYQTAYFALSRRAMLLSGETVVVLGAAGGVGTAAIQVAKGLGAHVIAVVHRDGAGDFLRDLGADDVVQLVDGWAEVVRTLTRGRGVDIVVDPIGGTAFDDAVRILAPEGRLLVIGFAAGGIPQIKVNRLLLRNASVLGVGWGEYLRKEPQALAEVGKGVADLVASGMKPAVTDIFRLDEARTALERLAGGSVLGKVVLEP